MVGWVSAQELDAPFLAWTGVKGSVGVRKRVGWIFDGLLICMAVMEVGWSGMSHLRSNDPDLDAQSFGVCGIDFIKCFQNCLHISYMLVTHLA